MRPKSEDLEHHRRFIANSKKDSLDLPVAQYGKLGHDSIDLK